MNRSLRWFVLFLIAAFCGHFALTTLYSFQPVPATEFMRYVSTRYSAPLFHQNWKLFAPSVPEYDCQLEYRFPENGKWSFWRDVSAGNGFSYNSRIETLEQSLTSSLAWQIANNLYSRNQRAQFDRIVSSFDYQRALFFTHTLHGRIQPAPIQDSIQVRVRFRFTPAMDQAHSSQVSHLELPVYSYQP